jgi:hypothetical protein
LGFGNVPPSPNVANYFHILFMIIIVVLLYYYSKYMNHYQYYFLKTYLFLKDPQMERFDFNNVTLKSLIGLSISQLQEEK